jgi:hypothetical protein
VAFDDDVERPTTAEKIAPWIRRVVIGGALVWICVSLQNFYEDTRTHTIKVVYPLLLSSEKITHHEPNFDPQKAVWQPVQTAVPVLDGQVVFVKEGSVVYAVQFVRQTIRPEKLSYAWLKVGDPAPVVSGTAETYPDGVRLPDVKLAWSGKGDGAGYVYLDDAFMWDRLPRYMLGVPFQAGDLEQFRRALPAGTRFQSQPWKIAPSAVAEEIVPVK